MKRRLHSAKVKSEVVLAALQGNKTVAEIASQYHVHPSQVQEWKARALESLSGAFDKSSRKEFRE